MRTPGSLGLSLFIALGCGSTSTEEGGAATGGVSAGGNGSATGGVPGAGGGTSGGEATSGGSAAGGAATGGSPASTGGATTGGSPASTGGAGSGLVDCDLRKVLCLIVLPNCPEGQVPSVNGTCYGPCTKIESCACSAAEECPDHDRYTCWSGKHCGPYVD